MSKQTAGQREAATVAALRKIGFPLPTNPSDKMRHEAIADFQRGFAFRLLVQDGYAGPDTQKALEFCIDRGGRCSENFAYREFTSKGTEDYTIKLNRGLVLGLEELRKLVGPIPILSGYRDPAHNHGPNGVGSMPNSQHLYGNAIDPGKVILLGPVLKVQRFSGIGTKQGTDIVRHLDVRHLGPNTTGSTVANPARWYYS